jgi:hypothetical protein
MKVNTKFRILEFIVAGLIIDTAENILSIKLSTGAAITKEVFVVAFLVVVPFSIVTELVIDHPGFWGNVIKFYRKLFPTKL